MLQYAGHYHGIVRLRFQSGLVGRFLFRAWIHNTMPRAALSCTCRSISSGKIRKYKWVHENR